MAVVTCAVSAELAAEFEAHAHLLAPIQIVGVAPATTSFYQRTYLLDCPDVPPGAASVTPLFQVTEDRSVSVCGLEWYDGHGRMLLSHGTSPAG